MGLNTTYLRGNQLRFFMKGRFCRIITFPSRLSLSCLYPPQATLVTMGSSYQGITERNCVPFHLVVGNINITSSWNFPGLPDENILTQLSPAVLTVTYIKCLLTCLTWYQPLSCEAGTIPCSLPYHIQRQYPARSRYTTYSVLFYDRSSFCSLTSHFTHHSRHHPFREGFLSGSQAE